jgi:lysyl-tRNA synthetase class II
MSNELEQRAQRQAKLDELIQLGVSPYPNKFDGATAIAAIVAAHGEKTHDTL